MLELVGVTKRFGQTVALDDLNLKVESGEVVAVLGPSGSGKSTLLRVIAGLEAPDDGVLSWNGLDIAGTPPHLRQFGLMFQSYALFPHLKVGENVGFGLRMQGADRVADRVREALSWVGLEGFESRPIEGLSGGEQQRVALARTLAPAPRLVMLDEPLGALDRALRERLVIETGDLLRSRAATALYVTHDHAEAEAVGDRVALLRAGRIVQIGKLSELRAHPADPWVADFVG